MQNHLVIYGVLEVECGERIYKDPQKTADIVKKNYGFAGKLFVEIVRKLGTEEIKEIQKDFQKELFDSDKMQKQAIALSIILTADKIATDYIFKDTKGDLYNGDKQRDYPLWRVKIENLSIVKVEQMFTVGKSTEEVMAEMLAANAALQKQIGAKGQEASIGGYTREWLLTDEYQAIGNYAQTVNNEYFESTSGPDGYLKVKQSGVYLISLQANLRKKTQDSSGNVWSKIVVNDAGNIGGDVHYMPAGTYYDTVNYVTYNYLNAGAKLKAHLSVNAELQDVWAQGGEYLNVVKLS